MVILSCDEFVLPVPPGHRFPMEKYRLLHERVVAIDAELGQSIEEPLPADDTAVLRAHDAEYLQRLVAGRLTPAETRRIGFGWSPELIERERLVAGATIRACDAALDTGVAVTLAGGTHHAFRDHGAGYCVFNDGAVAARALQANGQVERVAIVDCDVHQGDGTAAIFAGDPSVWTFSIHGARNYPFHKQVSDLDLALPDDTGDEAYLEALAAGLRQSLDAARPDLVIYVAGADPYCDDRLGRLALTKRGLAERDALVFDGCKRAGVPVAVTMAGGYARDVNDTVDIHLATVLTAWQAWLHG